MKVGDYVRTKYGIERLKKENDNGWFFEKSMIIKPDNIEKYIIKSRPRIIDLIEAGDYVNGYRVLNVLDFNDNSKMLSLENFYDSKITNEDIKSIVTKEQFSCMEYKIGE